MPETSAIKFESKPQNNLNRSYAKKIIPGELAEYLCKQFVEDYETQAIEVNDSEAIAQIQKIGKIRAVLGLRQCLTVRIHVAGSGSFVEIGKAAWVDKVASMGAGWIFSLGLPFLTAPWAIWMQHRTRRKIWALVEHYMH